MSLEELKIIDATSIPISKLIAMIFRGHTVYINHHLDYLDINAAQLHLLFEISHQKEINQEQIASRCNINKGSVARSIKKLEEKGLIIRKPDSQNRRQNKISLTEDGRKTLDESIKLLSEWEDEIFKNDIIEKELLQKALKEIAIKIIELNQIGE